MDSARANNLITIDKSRDFTPKRPKLCLRALVNGTKCMHLLLRAGAYVNKRNRDGKNACSFATDDQRKFLLLAAGEESDGTTADN